MTCPTCQTERGWWHKSWQKCAVCGDWPKPPDSQMALYQKGGQYYDAMYERKVAEAITEAARQAFHPQGGEPTKVEVVKTCAAVVTYLKALDMDARPVESLRIALGKD